ncbi:MAG: hypothetical protein WDO74_25670 [Pseudomonadota bacterium]
MNDARRTSRVAYLAALVITLILTRTTRARAQANDRSSPLGGRSALMGNTGVALGRDGAAPFLNPATVVGIDDRRLAFSVNFLALQVNHFKDWHQPDGVDPRFGEVSLGGPRDLLFSHHHRPVDALFVSLPFRTERPRGGRRRTIPRPGKAGARSSPSAWRRSNPRI